MRVVIQRVRHASVSVAGEVKGQIGIGLLVLVGVEDSDGEAEVRYLSRKITAMRLFPDSQGVMNRSLIDIEGELLLVSQFTLMADTRKGNRPSYIRASKRAHALSQYQALGHALIQELGRSIQWGEFGADMQVELCNDGPVTILVDTQENLQA